jgi:hypothetical protein
MVHGSGTLIRVHDRWFQVLPCGPEIALIVRGGCTSALAEELALVV